MTISHNSYSYNHSRNRSMSFTTDKLWNVSAYPLNRTVCKFSEWASLTIHALVAETLQLSRNQCRSETPSTKNFQERSTLLIDGKCHKRRACLKNDKKFVPVLFDLPEQRNVGLDVFWQNIVGDSLVNLIRSKALFFLLQPVLWNTWNDGMLVHEFGPKISWRVTLACSPRVEKIFSSFPHKI